MCLEMEPCTGKYRSARKSGRRSATSVQGRTVDVKQIATEGQGGESRVENRQVSPLKDNELALVTNRLYVITVNYGKLR